MQEILFTLLLMTTSQLVTADDNYGKLCLSNGDCQEAFGLAKGERYFLIKGSGGTCSYVSYRVTLGSTCKAIPGERVGLCKKEGFKLPDDFANPNCDNAYDSLPGHLN